MLTTTSSYSLLSIPTWGRRKFLTTLSFASALLSGSSLVFSRNVNALETTHSDVTLSNEMVGTQYGGDLPLFVAKPKNVDKDTPIVLVIQEVFGVHDYIKRVCADLASEGYIACAPELYFRQGDPRSYTDIPTLIKELVSRVPDAQVLQDLDDCVAHLKQQGYLGATGITGFCWGGRITWLYTAHNPNVKAAVAWYGRLDGVRTTDQPTQPVDVVQHLNAPVLGLYAGEDPGIPLSQIEDMKTRLTQGSPAALVSEFVVYPDAHHGFHADYRTTFHEASARDGWERCVAWLNRLLK